MTTQNAMDFIQKVEKDERLRDKIKMLGSTADLDAIVNLGLEAGFTFSIEDLRVAFAKDWKARRVFYKSDVFK